ncbi:LOW QUALITY PROTEIN: pentatricopeptide repeat-containing protein At4g33990 [Amborella trichopoda]|uniref:LOW QUALITY PROTEIN: pentatricopeptide repeat-containing protein At4g33990 n=1 Tax=Amborella trichopoda TaxID=13333 RepID=UPI0009BE259C|nr:LOW QUALITY PROTEIN: pentatricopeptide repeat-containing protein At4g33990 [Amborella trichopoda]|eukprot:XP_011627723.2 LOW QUALITY PROTEIN: pentatricopeptide repeat-containing protein At4g33990 [Amborella trichopoda]
MVAVNHHASCSLSLLTSQAPPPPRPSHGAPTAARAMDLFGACSTTHHARQLHAFLLVSGRSRSPIVATKLISLYAFLGNLPLSLLSFRSLPDKNVFTYNSAISACVRLNSPLDALRIFSRLAPPSPDRFTFPAVLKACAALLDLRHGSALHSWAFKAGCKVDVFVASSLVHMYAKCRALDDARQAFDEMPVRDIGAWNAMISAYCQNGQAAEAVGLFEEMRAAALSNGLHLDSVTVASVLPAFPPIGDVMRGRLVHGCSEKCGLVGDIYVSNALIDMYAKCGFLADAQQVFDEMEQRDVVSWNALISAYEQEGDPLSTLDLYAEMKCDGFSPDELTIVSLASACVLIGDCLRGRSVHGYIMRHRFGREDVFVGNAIVDMYAKAGRTEDARKAFEEMPRRDVVSWNTMITGYAQNGLAEESIELYNRMLQCSGFPPDQGTLVSVLPACSHVGAFQQGLRIHGLAVRMGLESDLFVGTCLIDMYAKCGRLNEASCLFEHVPKKSSVPWNAIISGHGVHGHGHKTLKLFEEMQKEGVKPDHVTFVSLLSACSHAGLVDQGQRCFDKLLHDHNVAPTCKHYACMVDLLGRAGRLEAAHDLINSMPMRPDASVWGALLGACRIHGDLKLAGHVSKKLFELDPQNVGYYVLMSNIYATASKWEGVAKVRSLAMEQGLKKTPGWSSIEVSSHVHVFFTGSRSHPRFEEIYDKLESLLGRIKSIGYVPDFSYVLQDVEEDEKENILNSHNERLAIAFGIISTAHGMQIQIFKNLRVCGDCHNATKFISKVEEREIVVRDANRFHRFRDGICSCGDYW